MEKLIVNYHTGVTEEVEGTLEDAKKVALEGIAYTQEKVTIEDTDGEVLTVARWYGVNPTADDDVLVQIGEGFYTNWIDA